MKLHRRGTSRRGASLIELTVMMGMMSVVMTLVGRTMVLLMRCERTGRDAVVAASGVTRMSNRFRGDVHAAEKAELFTAAANGQKSLRLTHANGTIVEYSPAANRMTVTTRRGRTKTAYESYKLQGTTRFKIGNGPSPVVTLIHIPDHGRIADAKSGAKNDKQIRVEAVRGYDLRYKSGVRQ